MLELEERWAGGGGGGKGGGVWQFHNLNSTCSGEGITLHHYPTHLPQISNQSITVVATWWFISIFHNHHVSVQPFEQYS